MSAWKAVLLKKSLCPLHRVDSSMNKHTQLLYTMAPKQLLFSFFFLFFGGGGFLGPHPWNMEVPRLGVELELQLPTYTSATAIGDPSLVCNLHHSSWQCRILNPLSEARNRTHFLTVPVGFVTTEPHCELLLLTPFVLLIFKVSALKQMTKSISTEVQKHRT